MFSLRLVAYLSVFCLICLNLLIDESNAQADCQTLRARCNICTRSLYEGVNEENLADALNRRCRLQVGRTYVWRNLKRCDMAHIRCIGYNQTLNCASIAKLAKMQRRLP